MNENQPTYKLQEVTKEVKGPKENLIILNNINFHIQQQESIAIIGASGSGKTTLLHLLGGLDSPTSGKILFQNEDISDYNWEKKAVFRNNNIGFIFQFHHLLFEFNTIENVAMPAIISGQSKKKAFEQAYEILNLVGLIDQAYQPVATLSGGERQLAAISRALIKKPQVVLADEPTGDLDRNTGEKVGNILLQINDQIKTTLVVVTHNIELANKMERKFQLYSGELYESNEIDSSR